MHAVASESISNLPAEPRAEPPMFSINTVDNQLLAVVELSLSKTHKHG
jgi:hypothetical protein